MNDDSPSRTLAQKCLYTLPTNLLYLSPVWNLITDGVVPMTTIIPSTLGIGKVLKYKMCQTMSLPLTFVFTFS